MVSLWKNPAGDVTLTSVPVATASIATGISATEDDEKIRELKNIISSLQSELKTVSIVYLSLLLVYSIQ